MAILYLEHNRLAKLGLYTAGAVLIGFCAMTAQAQTPGANWIIPKGVNKVLKTLLPSWQVGDIDSKLSRLCSFGRFNQKIPYKYSGHFQGPNGASLVGGAKGSGLNLFDPTGARKPDHDYWFYRDRSNNCIVYSAKVKTQPVRK